MRKLISFFALFAATAHCASAQSDSLAVRQNAQERFATWAKPTKTIYLEGFGASSTIGLNFDSRFTGDNGWGYRVGLSFCSSSYSFLWDDATGVAVPLEINYLLGKRNSKLELGVGTSLGYYKVEEDSDEVPSHPESWRYGERKTFGYFVFLDIGYRYQPAKGFDFRIGITPSFDFGGRRGIYRHMFYPYISLGYAFK